MMRLHFVITCALLALLCVNAARADEPPLPEGWAVYPTPAPHACDWTRANWSKHEWRVRADGERLIIEPWTPLPPRTDTPRFEIPQGENAGRGEPCRDCVMHTDDGWLVGFNFGEWGGNLWWTDVHGRGAYAIKIAGSCPDIQGADFPSAEQREYFGDRVSNVRYLYRAGDQRVYAFAGLSHMGLASGELTRIDRVGEKWQACLIRAFGAAPYAVTPSTASSWLVLTSGRSLPQPDGGVLLHVDTMGKVREIFHPKFSALDTTLYANSMVRLAGGTLYIGMRHFVGRLTPDESGSYREELLLPKDRPPFDFEPAIDGPNPVASCKR